MTSSLTERAANDDQQIEVGWRPFLRRNRRYLQALATLLVIALFGLAIFHLTSEVQYGDVVQALADTSWTSVAAAVFFTALSFFALTFYDVGALDYVRRKLPYADVALTAACAYAVGNTAGFGALSGGAIRYRSYSRLGIEPENIARIIAFVTLAFGLGLLTVTCLSLLAVGEYVAPLTGLNPFWLRMIAVAILGVVLAVFVKARDGHEVSLGRFTLRLPDSRTSSRQFLVTALDLAASATVLYVLLPAGTIGWPAFLAIYSLAVGIGVLSHVPAGLGVFETIIIATLGHSADVDTILGALVLYRVIYHVLPLLIAIAVVIGTELRQLSGHPVASSVRRIGGRITPLLLATLGIVLAIMLVLSSVTPTPDENLAFLEGLLPLPIVEGAHFLASLLGLALVIVSRGLAQRLDGAWWASVAIAVAALLLSLIKAIALVEAGMLAFFLVGLLASRRLFVRPASLFGQALTLPWLTALGVICLGGLVVLLFVYRDVEYSHELWWQFEFSAEAPRGLRALLGVTIGASAVAHLEPDAPGGLRRGAGNRRCHGAGIGDRRGAGHVRCQSGAHGRQEPDVFRRWSRLHHVWPARPLVDRAVRPGGAGRCLAGTDLAVLREGPRQRLPRGVLSGFATWARLLCRCGTCAPSGSASSPMSISPDFEMKGGKWANLRQTGQPRPARRAGVQNGGSSRRSGDHGRIDGDFRCMACPSQCQGKGFFAWGFRS